MTIYAVTDGDYSDYHIVALTVNKERAEHIANFYKTAEKPNVEMPNRRRGVEEY